MDLRQLKDRAQKLFAKQSYAKAADAYAEACAAAPEDLLLRQHLATSLHRAGKKDRAIEVFREIAAAYADGGQLLRAIAVNKLILEIAPDHTETQKRLAQLYAKRRTPSQMDALRAMTPRSLEETIESETLESTSENDFVDEGLEVTERLPSGALPDPTWAQQQGEISSPLFENLDPESFIDLLQRCDRRAFEPGDVIIREGESARSFFVLVSGDLRVVQGPLAEPEGQIELARLAPRDFFGEMALLSHRPRMASVVAKTEGELLEFPETVFKELRRNSTVTGAALDQFLRTRVLENAMASTEMFRPYDRARRARFLKQFKLVAIPHGKTVLTQGKIADGFYVVMDGTFRVERNGETLSFFGVGDCFGESSLVTQTPATASVVASSASRVLRLSAMALPNLAMAATQ